MLKCLYTLNTVLLFRTKQELAGIIATMGLMLTLYVLPKLTAGAAYNRVRVMVSMEVLAVYQVDDGLANVGGTAVAMGSVV